MTTILHHIKKLHIARLLETSQLFANGCFRTSNFAIFEEAFLKENKGCKCFSFLAPFAVSSQRQKETDVKDYTLPCPEKVKKTKSSPSV